MENTITKTYLKLKGNNQYLKVELYYKLGGVNLFTYKQEARGFYLAVTPVERTEKFESFTAFTGSKVCVHECKRFSKKAAELAQVKAKDWEQRLIDHVLTTQQLELEQLKEMC